MFRNDGYTRMAVGPRVAVTSERVTLTATPTSVAPDQTLTATWDGVESPTANDWIGLFRVGADDQHWERFVYATGSPSGSKELTVPTGLAAGTYELPMYADDGYVLIARSAQITVTS